MYPIRLFLRKKPILILLFCAILLHIAVWGWLAYYIRPQEAHIFLHYNVLFGVDLTGPWYYVFFLPIAGAVMLIVNTLLAWLLYNKDRFASYLLLFVSIVAHIFLFIDATLLTFLNI